MTDKQDPMFKQSSSSVYGMKAESHLPPTPWEQMVDRVCKLEVTVQRLEQRLRLLEDAIVDAAAAVKAQRIDEVRDNE